ncbi:MAG: type II toxin-antitoxin system PemK/MazF family toxin [Pirellulales bacterium]|nr:type II toxin-antitoxin system PemK/MazF family toxin [Pirellulales bacterium]
MGNLPRDSKIKADQIRTIDKSRLIREIGILPKNVFCRIEDAIIVYLEL